jgi:superfamily II DNA or RNA helicase
MREFLHILFIRYQCKVMKTILSHKGYSIYKKSIDNENLAILKKNLIVTPELHPDFPPSKSFPVYEEGLNWFRVPRVYGLTHFGKPNKYVFANNTLEETKCQFSGQLRSTQVTPHDIMLNHLFDDNGCRSGLLCLATGSGKTVVTLSLLSHIKQRTCILVHKSQLLQQWKAEINQFLPNMKIGIIQQIKKEFSTDCDIYLIMIQTLINIDFVPPIFGVTVIDECHHIPSTTFSKVLFKVNAKFVIGLTATPNRKDGLTQVLHWHIGDIIYQEKPDRKEQMTTLVEIYRYVPDMLYMDPKKYAQIITALCSDKNRNLVILNAIQEHLDQDDKIARRILILTERVNHAKTLYVSLSRKYENKRTCGLLIGGMKKDIMEQEMQKMILVATFNLMSEGISIAQLNSIVFASPKKDVVQALGRIFRKIHQNINPLIIDISDTIFRGQERARLAIYKKELNGNIKINIHEPIEEIEINHITESSALPDVYRNIISKPSSLAPLEQKRTCLLEVG